EALRGDELNDVAGADEFLAGVHGALEVGAFEVAGRHGDGAGVEQGSGRQGVGPGEDGVELGEFGGGAVVGGGGVDAAGEVGVDAEAQGLFGAVKDEQRVADHEVEQGSAELVGSGDGHGGLDAGDV